MKTAEERLFDKMTEMNFTYVSFPAFVENESSVDVFDVACKAIEEMESRPLPETEWNVKRCNIKGCTEKPTTIITGTEAGIFGMCEKHFLEGKEKGEMKLELEFGAIKQK